MNFDFMDKIRGLDARQRTIFVVCAMLAVAFVAFTVYGVQARIAHDREQAAAESQAAEQQQTSLLAEGSDDARRAGSYGSSESALFENLAGSLWATRDGSSVWSFSLQRDAISFVENGSTTTMPFVIYGTNTHDGTITAVVKIGDNFDVLALNAQSGTATGGDHVMINGFDEEPHYRKNKIGEVEVNDTPSWLSGLGIDASELDASIEVYVLAAHPAANKATFTGTASVTEKAGSTRAVSLEYSLDDGSKKALKVTAYSDGSAPSITG